MASKPPDAFLSYTRFDDQHDGGAISEFRRRLTDSVRAVTGEPFEIFQDIDGIGLGEHWPGKLDEMLRETRFFIPVLTPSFFRSKACRDEIEKFLHAEAERDRNDLVLPIYYIECDLLEDDDLRAADPLASTLHGRQRQDWRELRFESFDAANVRRALERLAREIVKARGRPKPQRLEGDDARSTDQAAPTVRRQTEISVPDTLAPSDSTSLSRPEIRQPGKVFRDVDAPWCPKMVVIPPGEFLMGSTEAEQRSAKGAEVQWYEGGTWGFLKRVMIITGLERIQLDESPQHRVRIAYCLAVGRYPVTCEEYHHFAEVTGCDTSRGSGRQPVSSVSWDDAKAYVEWLAAETGQPYRLLSEAEWEYACRAGTATRYWWGNGMRRDMANCWPSSTATDVDRYASNPWGLCDLHGNVFEWVEDCWHDSYVGAPEDGSAWVAGAGFKRVLRGGSHYNRPGSLRSASRHTSNPDRRDRNHGFRIARTLTTRIGTASPLRF